MSKIDFVPETAVAASPKRKIDFRPESEAEAPTDVEGITRTVNLAQGLASQGLGMLDIGLAAGRELTARQELEQELGTRFEAMRKERVAVGLEPPKTKAEWATTPTVHIPKLEIGKDDSFLTAAGKEVANLAVGLPEFASTPLGANALAGSVVSPAVAAATRIAFAVDMVKGMFDQSKQLRDNWGSMSAAEKGKAVADFGGSALMSGLLLKPHGKTVLAPFEKRTAPAAPVSPEFTPAASRLAPSPMERARFVPPLRVAPAPAAPLSLPPPVERPTPTGEEVLLRRRGAEPGAPAPPAAAALVNNLVPAVKTMDEKMVAGKPGETHNQIIEQNDLQTEDINRRTFVNQQTGEEVNRQEVAPAVEALGVKPTVEAEAGRPAEAHSGDLAEAQAKAKEIEGETPPAAPPAEPPPAAPIESLVSKIPREQLEDLTAPVRRIVIRRPDGTEYEAFQSGSNANAIGAIGRVIEQKIEGREPTWTLSHGMLKQGEKIVDSEILDVGKRAPVAPAAEPEPEAPVVPQKFSPDDEAEMLRAHTSGKMTPLAEALFRAKRARTAFRRIGAWREQKTAEARQRWQQAKSELAAADAAVSKARTAKPEAPAASETPPAAEPTFKEGQKVWVGQEPMHREGVLAGPGPRGGWFVKTNLGELFYEAKDIRPFEEKPTPPPAKTTSIKFEGEPVRTKPEGPPPAKPAGEIAPLKKGDKILFGKGAKLTKGWVQDIRGDKIQVGYYNKSGKQEFREVPASWVTKPRRQISRELKASQFKGMSPQEKKAVLGDANAFRKLVRESGPQIGWIHPDALTDALSKEQAFEHSEEISRGYQRALKAIGHEGVDPRSDIELAKLLPKLREWVSRQDDLWAKVEAEEAVNVIAGEHLINDKLAVIESVDEKGNITLVGGKKLILEGRGEADPFYRAEGEAAPTEETSFLEEEKPAPKKPEEPAPPAREAAELRPAPKVTPRALTKKEQAEFEELSIKAKAAREGEGPSLTTEETQRYQHLEALAGQGAFFDLASDASGRMKELADKAAEVKRLRDLAMRRAYDPGAHYLVQDAAAKEARQYQAEYARLVEQIKKLGGDNKPPPDEGDLIGMGAAISEEFEGGAGTATGIKNASIDRQRQERGELPIMGPLRKPDPVLFDAAMAKLDRVGPSLIDDLIDELEKKPRQHTDEEAILLLHREADLRNEYAKATRALAQAYDDGRTADVAELNARITNWSDQLNRLEDVLRTSGTEMGRAFRARRFMMNESLELADMERAQRAALGGRPLTPDERAELIRTRQEILKARDEAQSARTARDEALGKAKAEETLREQIQKALDEAKAEAAKSPKFSQLVMETAQKWVDQWDKEADESRNFLAGKFLSPTPEDLYHLARIARSNIAHFGLDFAKFAADMTKQLGEGVRPYLAQAWARAQGMIEDMGKKIPTAPVKEAVKKVKAGIKTVTPEDMAEKIRQRVAAGKQKEIAPLVRKLARLLIRTENIRELDPLLDRLHPILEKIMPEITRREVRDAFSGYGDFKPPKDDEISATVAELRGQGQQVSKLEDIIGRKPPLRSGVGRLPPQDIQRRLIKMVNDAKRRFGVVVSDPATQLRSALDARKTYLRNQIADMDAQIAQGKKFIKERAPSPTDPELESLRQAYEAKKAEFNLQFPKAPPTAAEKLARRESARRTNLQNQIRQLEEAIAKRERIVKERPAPLSAADIQALEARRNSLKEQYDRILPEPGKTEAEILAELKGAIDERIADLEQRMREGDFEPRRTRRRDAITPDEELLAKEAHAKRVEEKWRAKLMEYRMKQRPTDERLQDRLVKWRQAFVISGIKSLAKLISASAEGIFFIPATELAGSALRRIPVIREVAKRAPRHGGGFNTAIEAKALAETWRNLIDDFKLNVKGKKPAFEAKYGPYRAMPAELENYVGFLHGALKSPLARNAFTRAYAQRAQWALEHGKDITDPLVDMEIGRQAWEESSFWRFQNKNLITSMFRQGIARLEAADKKTGKVEGGRKLASTLIKAEFPVISVPTNILYRTFEVIGGVPLGLSRLGMDALRGTIRDMPPERADLIMRNLKVGSVGMGMFLIGFLNPEKAGGYYHPGEKRGQGELGFGQVDIGGVPIPTYLLHNPFLEAIQFGATMRRVADAKMRKTSNETNGLWLGTWASVVGVVEQQPFVREAVELPAAFRTTEAGKIAGQHARSFLIPMAVQWLAQLFDKFEQRRPETFTQEIEMGIPGLRSQVPERGASGSYKGP